MESRGAYVRKISDAEDADLDDFRGLKHRKLPPECILAEGYDAILLLLRSKFSCMQVLLQPHMESRILRTLQERGECPGRTGPTSIRLCSIEVMEQVTEISLATGRSNLAFAVARRLDVPVDVRAVFPGVSAPGTLPLRLVVLDGLTDAVNVGTLFRVAAALGISGVLCSQSCCDPFSARAVRVSAGYVFQLPCFQGSLPEALRQLRAEGVMTLAAVVQDGAVFFDEVDSLPDRWALVLGSEHFGVDPAVREACDRLVKIRMASGVDSLNVVTSGGVLMHGCVERETRACNHSEAIGTSTTLCSTAGND